MGNEKSTMNAANDFFESYRKDPVYEEDVRRLQEVWGSRKHMSLEEFSILILRHPDISEGTRKFIYKKFCRGLPKLTFINFVLAIAVLTRATPIVRSDFFSDLENCINDVENLHEFKQVELNGEVSKSYGNNSLYRILSGVTHFDETEISGLEELFSKVCDKKLLKITKRGFRTLLKGIISDALILGLFTVFNEKHNNLISFKEFVCGLSTLFLGPDNARITFMLQIWDTDQDGFLLGEDVSAIFNYFKAPFVPKNCPFTSEGQISIIDYMCWILADGNCKKLVADLISLADQIKYLGFGFTPDSDAQLLELVCDVRNRISLNDVEEWCIIPSSWWSKLIVSLCPHTTINLPFEDYEHLLTSENQDPKGVLALSGCVMLREGLNLRKDYELVSPFLWRALCHWTNNDNCMDVIVERCCLSKKFLPAGGWPSDGSWGRASDFPGEYFVELYPPLVQFLRHTNSSHQHLSTIKNSANDERLRYSVWRYMNLSCSISIGKLRLYISQCFHVNVDSLRLWSLEIEGVPHRSMLSNNSDTLHSLGIRSTAQFLLELQNEDMSWPEELIHLYKTQQMSRVNSENEICKSIIATGLSNESDENQMQNGIRLRQFSSMSVLSSLTSSGSERTISAPPAGVVNMGNTCYISAAVQSLSNVYALSEFILELSGNTDNESKKLGTEKKRELTLQYAEVLKSLLIKNECVAPKKLKEILAQKAGLFGDRRQHDCQEFLQIFSDLLHRELIIKRNTAASEVIEDDKKADILENDDFTKCQQMWNEHLRRENSVMVELFDGQLKSSLKCSNCSDVSSTFEIFSCVQLSLPIERFLFVSIKVVKLNAFVARNYALRVTMKETFASLKKSFGALVGIELNLISWLLINKKGDILHELCGSSTAEDESSILVKSLLDDEIQFFAYELPFPCDSKHISIISIHRTIVGLFFAVQRATYAIQAIDGLDVNVFGVPFFVQISENNNTEAYEISGSELYAKVLEVIHNSSIIFGRTLQTSKRNSDVSDETVDDKKNSSHLRTNRAIDANEDSRSGFPFELAFTKLDGIWCLRCHWSRFCRGCVVDPNSAETISQYFSSSATNNNMFEKQHASPIATTLKQCILAVNWKPEALYLKYDYSDEIMLENDDSFVKCLEAHQKPLSLDDCFQDFIHAETIADSRCDKCEKQTDREKSLRFCRFPNVLLIHLKRFVFVPELGRHIKSRRHVTFPLDEFDPSAYLAEECKNDAERPFYRCISIVNHHGDMNCGHYTTYIRRAERWFFFNDSYSRPIREDQIEKGDAYLLFYEKV